MELASLADGAALVSFISGEREKPDRPRRRSLGQLGIACALDSQVDLSVGMGRHSRATVGQKRRTRKLSNPEEAMTAEMWEELRRIKVLEDGHCQTRAEGERADFAAVHPPRQWSCWESILAMVHRHFTVAVLCGAMVGLSVINKVLFRLVLCSVGSYVHALSTSTNVAYLVYSWSVVFAEVALSNVERRSHLDRMLRFARRRWKLFASIGVCESVAFTLMPIGTPGIPKALVPVIAQSTLPMSMVMNIYLFKREYTMVQFSAVVLIVAGIVTATTSDPQVAPDDVHHSTVNLFGPLVIVTASYFFLVLSLILKDVAFRASAQEGEKLDIFLVEGVAGIGQGVTLFLAWPLNFALLTKLRPSEYFSAAAKAFTSSEGLMPMLILLYWAGNILYRLATLRALRQLSSLATLLANVLTVPLSALAFCLPLGLPLIGPPDQLSLLLIVGTLVVCLGLMLFNSGWECRGK